MMKSISAWVIALLLAVIAAGGLWQSHNLAQARQEALQASERATRYQGIAESYEAALEAATALYAHERQVLSARAAQAQAQAAEQKEQSRVLAEALRAHVQWAATPVPIPVLQAIAGAGDGHDPAGLRGVDGLPDGPRSPQDR